MEFDNNKINLNDTYIGTVMDIDVNERICYVFIPKLMMALPESVIINNEHQIKTSNIINKSELNVATFLEKTNVLEVYAEDIDEPMPEIGSTVQIYFLESNPKYAYWKKFNPVGKYNVIQKEKYPETFKLIINGKQISVNKNDNIEISIPEDYEVSIIEDGKNKRINILENDKIKNSIYEMKKYVSLLQENMNSIVKENKDKTKELISSVKTNLLVYDEKYTKSFLDNVGIKELELETTNSLANLKTEYNIIEKESADLANLITNSENYKSIRDNIQNQQIKDSLLTDSELDNVLINNFNALVKNNTDYDSAIQSMKDKTNPLKKINYYFDNNIVSSKNMNIGDETFFPTINEMYDAYTSVINDNDHEDVYKSGNICSIGPISIHKNTNISSETVIEVNQYVTESIDYNLNLVNLDIDPFIIDNGDYINIAILDSTKYTKNNKQQILVNPNNFITCELIINDNISLKYKGLLVQDIDNIDVETDSGIGWMMYPSNKNITLENAFDDDDNLSSDFNINIKVSEINKLEFNVEYEYNNSIKLTRVKIYEDDISSLISNADDLE